MLFPTKQCVDGYSVAYNRSKEIKTRLPSEAIQHMSEIIKYTCENSKPFSRFFVSYIKQNGFRS